MNLPTLKILMVASMALFMTLAVIANLTLPLNGFQAVAGTVGMLGTKQQPEFMWRAISSDGAVWILWGLIVAGEALGALLCWLGAFRLLKTRSDVLVFNRSKTLALTGLGFVAFMYFLGWQVIANEWFLMWQLPAEMDAVPDGFYNAAMALLILLFVNTDDR